MISNINCLVFLLEGCSLAGRMERNWQIGPAPLISRMTEQWRVAVTQAPGTNTRGNDCRELSLLVWTTNVSTGCMKNEICSVLWLLGTAPLGTEDVRNAQALCCFPLGSLGDFLECAISTHKVCRSVASMSWPLLFPYQCCVSSCGSVENGTLAENVPTRQYWFTQSTQGNLVFRIKHVFCENIV